MVIFFGLTFFACQDRDAQAEPPTEYASFAKESFAQKLAAAGEELEDSSIIYDPSYVRLDYPMGDVPAHTGVCTDVLVRAYRKLGIDLQKEVHEDILRARSAYRGIKKPDRHIDHRRVPNLVVFFARHGESLPVSKNAKDYKPGDIVWWKLGSPTGLNHIGLVVKKKSTDGERHLVIHNVGGGQVVEDFLFSNHIQGHFRYVHDEEKRSSNQ